ncbi:MAG: hypothetical protein OEV59_00310 [Deltaproteobacteria bacterium]|nr:hypothetical protein [Deltaproteobacteria bacterium]
MSAYTIGALVGTVLRLALGILAARSGIKRFSLNPGTAWTVIVVLTAIASYVLTATNKNITFANSPWIVKFYVNSTEVFFILALLFWIVSLVAGKKPEKAEGKTGEK